MTSKTLIKKIELLSVLHTLPYHHCDPFGRLIISQAIAEDLSIISAERHFTPYSAPVIWE